MQNLRDFRRDLENVRKNLVAHLQEHALRIDGPFTLRSGEISGWYVDGRQTTLDGEGAELVGRAVLAVIEDDVTAVGGMTMGADPMAVAAVVVAQLAGMRLRAFSVRKEAKSHGLGGRLVGPVGPGDRVAVLEDTTTTGGAFLEAITVVSDAGLEVVQAVALFDRSDGIVANRMAERDIPYQAIVTPEALGNLD